MLQSDTGAFDPDTTTEGGMMIEERKQLSSLNYVSHTHTHTHTASVSQTRSKKDIVGGKKGEGKRNTVVLRSVCAFNDLFSVFVLTLHNENQNFFSSIRYNMNNQNQITSCFFSRSEIK